MPPVVWTAPAEYEGEDRLDVSLATNEDLYWAGERGGHRGIGRAFSPSVRTGATWATFRKQYGAPTERELALHLHWYVEEMRASFRKARVAWNRLLGWRAVTFAGELPFPWCHRQALVEILQRLGCEAAGARS